MVSFINRLRSSELFQRALRVLQFISAAISLGLFSARLAKIIRLAGKASRSNGAVEGILCAAVLYTLFATLLKLCLRGGGPKFLRWILIVLDLAFVGAFTAVAVLTSPSRGGSSGPCTKSQDVNNHIPQDVNCNLPWGTFILAIVSTVLHALTAAFREVRDHHKQKKIDHERKIENDRNVEGGRIDQVDNQ